MSILIKGMDMPTSCGMCRFCLDDSRICNGYCMYFHRRIRMDILDEHCPFVEVPTPHGRLVDADELIKHDHQHYEHLSDEFYITVRDIENAPTIIETEEG